MKTASSLFLKPGCLNFSFLDVTATGVNHTHLLNFQSHKQRYCVQRHPPNFFLAVAFQKGQAKVPSKENLLLCVFSIVLFLFRKSRPSNSKEPSRVSS